MTKARDIASASPAPSTVSATEIGYLDGVTSAIQTQIDSKIGSASAISPTLIDAKGDLIVGSAADTAARLAVGTNNHVLTADSAATNGVKWAAVAGGATYAIFADEKASGGGGTFTSGAWRTRDLNTTVYNGITGCSISSNQITLAAGTYIIEAHMPFQRSDWTATRLYNVTDSSVAGFGGNGYIDNSSEHNEAIMITAITIAATKTFEIQMQGYTTRADTGFGQNHGFQTEVYTQVLITKIG